MVRRFFFEQYGPHQRVVQACSLIHYQQSQIIFIVCLCRSTPIPGQIPEEDILG